MATTSRGVYYATKDDNVNGPEAFRLLAESVSIKLIDNEVFADRAEMSANEAQAAIGQAEAAGAAQVALAAAEADRSQAAADTINPATVDQIVTNLDLISQANEPNDAAVAAAASTDGTATKAYLSSTYATAGEVALSVERYAHLADTFGTDWTPAFAAALAALPASGTLTGKPGKSYTVTGLDIARSDITIEKLALRLADEAGEWAAPIKMLGTREAPISGITLRSVTIDGNRTNQTIVNNVSGNAIDSRPGIALYGVISDVTIEDCTITHNAGDGLWLYSKPSGMGGTTRTTDDDVCIRNVKVVRSRFTYNRRHGGALDSVDGATFEDCDFTNNGTTINGGATSGDQGETYFGDLFGNGFDLEGYGRGTCYKNIAFSRCNFSDNGSRSVSVLEPSAVSLVTFPDFTPRSNIAFERCVFDGVDGEGYSLYITPTGAKTNEPRVFADIKIDRCEFRTGKVLLTGIDGGFLDKSKFGTVAGGTITVDATRNFDIGKQEGITAANVFMTGTVEAIGLMTERNSLRRPLLTVANAAALPTAATNGTVAFIETPTSSNVYAWIRQSGAWRPLAQQMGPTVIVGGAPPGTVTRHLPLRDTDGTVLGYVPIYTA